MIRKVNNLKSTRSVTLDLLCKIRDSNTEEEHFLLCLNRDSNKYEILWIDSYYGDGDIIFSSNLSIHVRNPANMYNLDELILVQYEEIRYLHEHGKYVDPLSIQHILDEFHHTTSDVLTIQEDV